MQSHPPTQPTFDRQAPPRSAAGRHLFVTGWLLAALLLVAALSGCALPIGSAATPTPVETATATPVPTARIVSTPAAPVVVFTPTPTRDFPLRATVRVTTTADISVTVQTTATHVLTTAGTISPTATPLPTAAPPQQAPVVRQGPGGLPYPLRLARLHFGAVGHFYYTDRETAYTLAQQGGFGWVRQQVHWRDIEDRSGEFFWGELDNIVADANAKGLLVLISVVRAPSWYTSDGSDGMPADPQALARFLGALSEHYAGQVHAIEVWNEQNLAHENGGKIALEDAGRYVELLAASYQAIKTVDPEIIVVAGAPASTATDVPTIAVPDIAYLRAMYSYRDGMIRNYFDIQALHPVSTANPPETLWPENPHTGVGWTDDSTFYFRHIEHARAVMKEAGLSEHQVWLTEFGWATANNTPGYEYGNLISPEQQREYIVRAMELTSMRYPWVSNMFVWNLNFTIVQQEHGVDPLHEQGSFSIVNADGTPRPAYLGMQQFIGQRALAQGQ